MTTTSTKSATDAKLTALESLKSSTMTETSVRSPPPTATTSTTVTPSSNGSLPTSTTSTTTPTTAATPALERVNGPSKRTIVRRQTALGLIPCNESRRGSLGKESLIKEARRGSAALIDIKSGSPVSCEKQDPWLFCKSGYKIPIQPQERRQYWKLPGVP